MLMKIEPVRDAIRAARARAARDRAALGSAAGERTAATVIYLSPQGRRVDQQVMEELAAREQLILVAGRYEGIDERVRRSVVDEEVSIGDFVLSGGEMPAMVLIEAVSRQIPGVVGLADSVANDSFRDGLLDHPHYTRPREIGGQAVPEVLLSGDHAAIARWRRREALRATRAKRPDLLRRADLDADAAALLAEIEEEEGPGG